MKRREKNWITIFIYELDSNINHRFDFSLYDLLIDDVLFASLFDDFNITQVIPEESTILVPPDYLDKKNVEYFGEVGIKKYGLFRAKTRHQFISDLYLPHNDSKFLYQFVFGNYMYLIADKSVQYDTNKIINWHKDCFDGSPVAVDNLYSGQINDKFTFPDYTDFIIITNYDSNRDLGIVIKSDKTNDLLELINTLFDKFQIDDSHYERFERCARTRVL